MDILTRIELEQLMRKEQQGCVSIDTADRSYWDRCSAGSDPAKKPAQRLRTCYLSKV